VPKGCVTGRGGVGKSRATSEVLLGGRVKSANNPGGGSLKGMDVARLKGVRRINNFHAPGPDSMNFGMGGGGRRRWDRNCGKQAFEIQGGRD